MMRRVVAWSSLVPIALAGTLAVGLPVETGQPREKVTFIPQWQPQAQFAGYYVALEKGFYGRQGLEVTILRGGPDHPPLHLLEQGKAEFGTSFLSSAIVRRSQGTPVVNIAQIVQRSALLLVAKRSSGIRSPADFRGRKVSLWTDFQIQPRALFRKYGVEPRIVTQRDTLNLFLRDGVSVGSAMWYNEYHKLLNAGLDEDELTLFHFDAYGLNFPEDGIYCLAMTLERRPALCRAFVRASVEGWTYAFEHPDEALDIVMRRVREANIATTRIHQRWMLTRMRDIIQPNDRIRLGHLARSDFDNVTRELLASGIIGRIPDFDAFYEACAP